MSNSLFLRKVFGFNPEEGATPNSVRPTIVDQSSQAPGTQESDLSRFERESQANSVNPFGMDSSQTPGVTTPGTGTDGGVDPTGSDYSAYIDAGLKGLSMATGGDKEPPQMQQASPYSGGSFFTPPSATEYSDLRIGGTPNKVGGIISGRL